LLIIGQRLEPIHQRASFRERSRSTRNLEPDCTFKPRAYPVNRKGMIVNQGYGGHWLIFTLYFFQDFFYKYIINFNVSGNGYFLSCYVMPVNIMF